MRSFCFPQLLGDFAGHKSDTVFIKAIYSELQSIFRICSSNDSCTYFHFLGNGMSRSRAYYSWEGVEIRKTNSQAEKSAQIVGKSDSSISRLLPIPHNWCDSCLYTFYCCICNLTHDYHLHCASLHLFFLRVANQLRARVAFNNALFLFVMKC